MGSTSSKTKTSTATNQTTTPKPPEWYANAVTPLASRITSLIDTPAAQFQTGSSANQAAASARALNGTGLVNPLASGTPAGQATRVANGLIGYSPERVAAGQLATTDLTPYKNIFTGDVIDTSLEKLRHERDLASNSIRSRDSGNFGSRNAVAEGELNAGHLRDSGSLIAGLNSANFAQAQAAAGSDIAGRMSADTFNSTMGLEGQKQQANVADLLAKFGLIDFNAGIANNADARATTDQMASVGATDRQIAKENNPMSGQLDQYAAVADLLARLNPQLFTGQNMTGTSNSTGTATPSTLDTIGKVIQAGTSLFGNPFKGMMTGAG